MIRPKESLTRVTMSQHTSLPAPDSSRGRDFVQSLARGLSVIRAFGAGHPQLTLSDVAKETGLSRAAARRFLLTLVQLGLVRSDGRFFSLRPKVLELGYAYLSALELPEIARPHLEELAAAVHESASVSVLEGDDIVYVVRVSNIRIMRVIISVGTRFPAYPTAMGRVLLAGLRADQLDHRPRTVRVDQLEPTEVVDREDVPAVLKRVREVGFAVVDDEIEPGLRSVAVPIHDSHGLVLAAVSVSGHSACVTMQNVVDELLPHLRTVANAIEADLAEVRPATAISQWPPAGL
jgi:IclR family transcriptional regulator, pca regulon regulatory protein